MTKTFVAINDPVHSLLRHVTRHTPLCPGLSPDQRLLLEHSFREQDLPEAYYSLAVFHAQGGGATVDETVANLTASLAKLGADAPGDARPA